MSARTLHDLKELAKQQVVNFFVLACVFLIVYFFRDAIRYNDIKDVLGVLQNISAAIFTIVGLWIGFLYPNAIASIVNDDINYIKNTKDAPRIEKLIYVVIVSAIVMVFILCFYLFKAMIPNIDFFKPYKEVIKIIGAGFIYFMSWLQIKCVFSVIISNLSFANNLHSRITRAKLDHDDD